METFRDTIGRRIHACDIRRLSRACDGDVDDKKKAALLTLAHDSDPRTAYNALWVLSQMRRTNRKWLQIHRDELIDLLLATNHVGKQRLLLTLLEFIPITESDLRTDYLDFCLSRINSLDPCAIRALSLKQAYAQCRFFPELMNELLLHVDMMTSAELPQGLKSTLRIIRRRMARVK